MPDHEHAMLAYTKLAEISQQKQQLQGRDKFLVLAAAAACQAGWPEVAERCRELVHANNPAHLIGRYETMADALRSEDFLSLLKSRQRFCSYERAEHILHELEVDLQPSETGEPANAGQNALSFLAACD